MSQSELRAIEQLKDELKEKVIELRVATAMALADGDRNRVLESKEALERTHRLLMALHAYTRVEADLLLN